MGKRKKKRARRGRCVQDELPFPLGWGGARKGAGRKKSENPGVSHLRRDDFHERHPVHVTMKLLPGLPSLRIRENSLVVLERLKAAQKKNCRIVHFSVQGNHLHLFVEAEGREALSGGMGGLAVRLSRGLNKHFGREGTVFADRFHSRVLRTPTEVRNALGYILRNRQRHTGREAIEGFDFRSSAMLFDGWKEMEAMELVGDLRPVVPAQSWLAQRGWMKAGGKLSLYDVPGPRRKATP